MMSMLTILAMTYTGTPYIWGGSNPLTGLDCSGFVQLPLQKLKIIDRSIDYTSQALHDFLASKFSYSINGPCENCILFFGKSITQISHVAIAINSEWMIEARGGDSKTKTLKDAVDKIAMVEMTRIDRRKDLVASIKVL